MNKSKLLDNYIIDIDKLVEYGFILKKDTYIYKYELKNSDFYSYFYIENNTFEIKVFDSVTEEGYLLFNVPDSTGKIVSTIREEIDNVIDDILWKCFSRSNLKEELLKYTTNVHGTIPETPFEKLPTSYTVKTHNKNKWYGLFMDITYKQLGIDNQDTVHILNVKNHPEKIEELIDYIHFFPAYHMNKKHWITIVLNKSTDVELVKKMIDDSYSIVEK